MSSNETINAIRLKQKAFDKTIEGKVDGANRERRQQIFDEVKPSLTALPHDIRDLYGDYADDILHTVYVDTEIRGGDAGIALGDQLIRTTIHDKINKFEDRKQQYEEQHADNRLLKEKLKTQKLVVKKELSRFYLDEKERIAMADFPWTPDEEKPRAPKLPHEQYYGNRSVTPRTEAHDQMRRLPNEVSQWYHESLRFNRELDVHRRPYVGTFSKWTLEPWEMDNWRFCYDIVMSLVENVLNRYLGFEDMQKPVDYDELKAEVLMDDVMSLEMENIMLEVTYDMVKEVCSIYLQAFDFARGYSAETVLNIAARITGQEKKLTGAQRDAQLTKIISTQNPFKTFK